MAFNPLTRVTGIAAGLGNELEINVMFPNGLAWLQLSETPDVNQPTMDLAAHLKAKLGSNQPLVEAGVCALADVIADHHLLLVIDDCWREDDIAEITEALAQCKNCVVLLTTRIASIARYAHDSIDVETVREDEAIALLAQNLPSQQVRSQEDVIRLVNRAGCWPLLVDLILWWCDNDYGSGKR